MEMKRALQEEIKSIDIFLLLLSGKNVRFDAGTQKLLLWYEAVFGKELWKHVIVETTFWTHTQAEIQNRKQNQQVVLNMLST